MFAASLDVHWWSSKDLHSTVDLDSSVELITLEKSSCVHESINAEVCSVVAARNVGGAQQRGLNHLSGCSWGDKGGSGEGLSVLQIYRLFVQSKFRI